MIQSLYAANTATQSPQGGDTFSMVIMMAGFFLIFYFLMIRPKQKKEQEKVKLLNNLNTGDEVITYSGIMGCIKKISDHYLVLNIADNVDIKIQKNHINNILPKGTLKSI